MPTAHHAFTGGAGALGVLQLTPPTNVKKKKKGSGTGTTTTTTTTGSRLAAGSQVPQTRVHAVGPPSTLGQRATPVTATTASHVIAPGVTVAPAAPAIRTTAPAPARPGRTRTRESKSEGGESNGSHSPTHPAREVISSDTATNQSTSESGVVVSPATPATASANAAVASTSAQASTTTPAPAPAPTTTTSGPAPSSSTTTVEPASWVQIFRAAQEERARERDEREQLAAQRIKDKRTRDGTTMLLPRRHSAEVVGGSSGSSAPATTSRRRRGERPPPPPPAAAAATTTEVPAGSTSRDPEHHAARPRSPRQRRNTLERRMNRVNVWDELDTAHVDLPPWTPPTDPSFTTALEARRPRAGSSASSSSTVSSSSLHRAIPASPPPEFAHVSDASTTRRLLAEERWKSETEAGVPLQTRLENWKLAIAPPPVRSEMPSTPQEERNEPMEWRGFLRPRNLSPESTTATLQPGTLTARTTSPGRSAPGSDRRRNGPGDSALDAISDTGPAASGALAVPADHTHDTASDGHSASSDSAKTDTLSAETPTLIREAILHRTPTLTTRRTALAAAAERRLRSQLAAKKLTQVSEDEQEGAVVSKKTDSGNRDRPTGSSLTADVSSAPGAAFTENIENAEASQKTAVQPSESSSTPFLQTDPGPATTSPRGSPALSRLRPKGPRPPSPVKSRTSLHSDSPTAGTSPALTRHGSEHEPQDQHNLFASQVVASLESEIAAGRGAAEDRSAEMPQERQPENLAGNTAPTPPLGNGPPGYRRSKLPRPGQEKLQTFLGSVEAYQSTLSGDLGAKNLPRPQIIVSDPTPTSSPVTSTRASADQTPANEGSPKIARRPVVLKFKGRSSSSRALNSTDEPTPAPAEVPRPSRKEAPPSRTRHYGASLGQSSSNVSSSDESSRSFASALEPRASRIPTLTELDLLLSRINSGSDESRYDDLLTLSEIIGPAIPSRASAEELDRLSVAAVEACPSQPSEREVMGVRCDACAICLSRLQIEQMAAVMPHCLHVFHQDCMTSWLSRVHTCPVCRVGIGDER